MQSVFTVLFEAAFVSAFAFFAIAFVTGFITYAEQASRRAEAVPDIGIDMAAELKAFDEYHQPAAPVEPPLSWGEVVSFSRPYRRPVSAPVDWRLWSADDLRLASQRSPFGIPLRNGGKKLTKPQLIQRYQAALGLTTAA